MKDVLLIIGIILGIIVIIILDVNAILVYNSSKKDERTDTKLFGELSFGSAVGVAIILTFTLVSNLF